MQWITRTHRKRFLPTVVIAAIVAITLAGWAVSGGGDNVGGSSGDSSVPLGASPETYQAALEDMTPTTLVWQVGGSSESFTQQPMKVMAENISKYSGGKIEIEFAWSNGTIQNPAEVDRALMDGRLDIGPVFSSYNAEEYPVNAAMLNTTVLNDSRVVTGMLSGMAAWEEVALNTPEAVAEFTDQGLTPLYMFHAGPPTVMMCSEPVRTIDDLADKQIRSATPGMGEQIEALGAVPVSLAYTEVYEALQRGILDCAMGTHSLGILGSWLEVAPYVMHTDRDASFVSTPTPYFGGIGFTKLPAVAQQLVMEMFNRQEAEVKEVQILDIVENVLPMAEQYGGGFYTFDVGVSGRLKEVNARLLTEVRNNELFDGKEFLVRLSETNKKWVTAVEELGYVDRGTVSDIDSWYSSVDAEGFADLVVEDLTPMNWAVRP